jgi:hypothetical protein
LLLSHDPPTLLGKVKLIQICLWTLG